MADADCVLDVPGVDDQRGTLGVDVVADLAGVLDWAIMLDDDGGLD